MKWRWSVLIAGVALSGCSANVGGIVGSENFRGNVKQGLNGTGTMEMQGDAGTKCVGNYTARSSTGGSGFLSCSDGRQAGIQYTTTSVGVGYGFGTANTGAPVRFYFGMNASEGAQYLGTQPPSTPGGGPSTAQPVRQGTGTGFFITRQGHVLTNAHVVDGCKTITVTPLGGTATPASTVSSDKTNDLAVLSTGAPPRAIALLRGGQSVRQGDSVVAYGFPLSDRLSSGGVMTNGSISALAGPRDDTRFFQISAPVQPGNSGGPLLDMSGTVVGVVSSQLRNQAGRPVAQNVNFAIKTDVVRTYLGAVGVSPETSSGGRDLALPDIGDRARAFTVFIECNG